MEMFEWLEEEYNVASDAFTELRADIAALQALQPQPTLKGRQRKTSVTCTQSFT